MNRMELALFVALAVSAVACTNADTEERMSTANREAAAASFGEAGTLVGARDYSAARDVYARAADEAHAAGDVALEAEACAQVARMHSQLHDPTAGAEWLARAERLTTPEMPDAWGRLLVVRGVYAREEGRKADAVALFEECYDYCMAHQLYGRAVDAAHHVAIAADPKTREEWALKGIAAAEAAEESGWLGPLWNNLGWDYIDAGRYDEALHALREAQKAHHVGGHPITALISDYSVGFALRMTGDYALARGIQEGVHKSALRALDEGDPQMLEWVAQSRRELGELDALEGRTAEGADRIEEAIAELKQTDFMQWGGELMDKYEARLAELRAQQ
ncbi:MAG: tetratricopeptide repeat protein [Planctomycetes bacterium]|nr:tetratricopeptide repeat protein [Planctomycetota bacterium]MCB9904187.1 tetratricopeptide repeat protein [Planctomycetota bacterium]